MNNVLKYYVRVFMFLMPILFLPIAMDPFGLGKEWLVVAAGLIGVVLWLVTFLVSPVKKINWGNFGNWWWLLVVWAGVSMLRETVGLRMNGWMGSFSLMSLLAVGWWWFLWNQVDDKETETRIQVNYLTAAGLLVGISSLVVFLIPSARLPIVWPKTNSIVNIGEGWSLIGSLVTEMVVLLFLVVEWWERLVVQLKKGSYLKQAVVLALLMLVLLLDGYRLNKVGWAKLDQNTAWVVAVESFRNNPIFGSGLGNFSRAFNFWRPVSYNMGKYWSASFKLSSMSVLQIWTELGLVGLGLWFLSGWMGLRNKEKGWAHWKTFGFWLVVSLIPFDLVGWLLVGWLVAGSSKSKEIELKYEMGEQKFNVLPWVVAVVTLVGLGLAGVWWTRVVLGETYIRKSLVAAAKNNGGETYNWQIKALGANPYSAEYRRLYSQTNLALAQTILINKDISDDDKQKASTLIQQSVAAAKVAVALDGQNSFYWNNLAVIYRQLVGIIDGTADWSYQAYSQAVALEPTNVLMKMDLGGLLYAAGKYEEADRVFEQVVAQKQDYANGWYNWAFTAKQLNKLSDAISRLTQAITLVPVTSGDYDSATKTLGEWKKEYDALVAKQTASANAPAVKQAETLKTPEPLPTVSSQDKVSLPSNQIAPPDSTGSSSSSSSSPTVEPTAEPTAIGGP